jgi:DNA mismatch repair protein MSH4
MRHLHQLADSQSYSKTLNQLNVHYPCLVLVPHTSLPKDNDDAAPSAASLLVQCIKDDFAGVPMEPVQRKYWNDIAGQFLFPVNICVIRLLSQALNSSNS